MAITTIRSVKTYQTSDGRTHTTYNAAQKHEAYLERRAQLQNVLNKANGNMHTDHGAYSRLLLTIQTNPVYGEEVIKNIRELLTFVRSTKKVKAS